MPGSATKDFYEILGVERNAPAQEIKRAYRKLARRYHPDVNQGGADSSGKFREVQQAYEVLGDPEKRKQYDRFGASAFQSGPSPGWSTAGGFDFSFDTAKSWGRSVSELFSDLFSGAGKDTKPKRGEDIQYAMDLSFADALRGVSATITLQKDAECAKCQGSGQLRSESAMTCPDCRGTAKEDYGRGPFRFTRDCQRCQGKGKVQEQACPGCSGRGLFRTEERIAVDIPAGVDDGSKVRLPGKGEPGLRGGEPGDLLILTRVQPHAFFVRKNLNIYCEVPLTFEEAALGAKVPVPTIDGIASMKVPPGTQSGQIFRLRERGVAHVDGSGRGDHFVTVRVSVPKLLDEDSKTLIRKLFQRLQEDPRQELFQRWEEHSQ